MDDEMILDLYFARSEDAIIHTKNKYEKYCVTIAHNILVSREDSEECVNDTWLSAWNAIPPARPKILSTYLGKITRNHALDRYRNNAAKKRGGSQVELVLDELADCISDNKSQENEIIDRQVLGQIMDTYLENLSTNARIVFMQRYWYMMSVKKIAKQNNISQSAVKMSLLRSRDALKQLLKKEGYGI